MQNLPANLSCYLFSFSERGYLSFVNEFFLNCLGYSESEICGKYKIEQLLSFGSKIFYQTHFYPLIKLKQEVEEIYLTFLSKNGEEIPVLLNAKIEALKVGYVIHCIGIRINQRLRFEKALREEKKSLQEALTKNEELNETKQILEQNQLMLDAERVSLEQRNQELIELNTVLSHNLQEPLRKIAILQDKFIVDHERELSDAQITSLKKIVSLSGQMRSLIHALQEFSSLITEDTHFDLLNVKAVLDQLQIEFEQDLKKCNGRVIIEGAFPSLNGNEQLLYILFKNLLENSLKFRDEQRSLLINITGVEVEHNIFQKTIDKYQFVNYQQIVYKDNGIGFDNKYNNQLFSLFKKNNTQKDGLGLGLAIAKKIVSIHRGTIVGKSEKNAGATFTILIPC